MTCTSEPVFLWGSSLLARHRALRLTARCLSRSMARPFVGAIRLPAIREMHKTAE